MKTLSAARQAEVPTVPVYVIGPAGVGANSNTVERIVHQIVTNDEEHDLTDAQHARGIQQMNDARLSLTKVAA